MAMPGIQTKLNIPKTQSPKELASTAVLHASRATTFSKPTSSSGNIFGSTGTRYGISAQRSKVGTGQHLNAKAFYNNNNTSALRDMNSRAFFSVDSYAPVFIEHNHNGNKMSGLEKALMWTTAGLGIAGMAMSTINAFKTPDNPNNSIKKISLSDSEVTTNVDISKLALTKKLRSAISLTSVNHVEVSANEKLNNFQENYSADIQKSITGINDVLNTGNVKEGLKLAGVSLDTSRLKGSNLNINTSDLASIDTATKTIDNDIKTANNFINKDIHDAIGKLTTKSGELAKSIGELTASYQKAQVEEAAGKNPSPSSADIQKQINEAKAQKEQVDRAKAELETTVTNAVKELVSELQKKITELTDIKQVKTELADKKYQVAADIQKNISKDKSAMDKLMNQINNSKTSNRADLLAQYRQLVVHMKDYRADINNAGNSIIKNAKGDKTINLDELRNKVDGILAKEPVGAAQSNDVKSEQSQVTNSGATLIIDQINNCVDMGSAVTIDNKTYTLNMEGSFISGDSSFTRAELIRLATGNATNSGS